MCALDANGNYAIQCLKKVQNENLKSFSPKNSACDAFNEHTQTWSKSVVWGQGCRTWYYDPDTGRNRAVYAGSSMHYREMLASPRWEDMDIEYGYKSNMYAFMGIGRHMCQTEEGRKAGISASPYTDVKRVDPRMIDSNVATRL
jgi:hypothetical protein